MSLDAKMPSLKDKLNQQEAERQVSSAEIKVEEVKKKRKEKKSE